MSNKKLNLKPIKNQVIVITGASSGIGLATAKMAAKRGAKVVLSSRNLADLEAILKELTQAGHSATAVEADVSRKEDLEHLRDSALRSFGIIDTWVNNAAASIYGSILESTLEEDRQLFETNFWGVVNGSRIALQVLRNNTGGGVLINLGSEVSARAIPIQGMYASSKHAVKAFTDAFRMELEAQEIPVAVCLIRPAGIDTPFTEHAKNNLESGEPSLPAPVYHPDVVAEAILKCAHQPQRDVFVGGASKLFTVLEAISPRMADYFMESMLIDQQSKGSNIPHREENEGLMSAPLNEGKVRGEHKGYVFKNSLYTKMTTHPWMTAVAAAGASALFLNQLKKASVKSGQTPSPRD